MRQEQGRVLRFRALLLGAIGVNRMRQENADTRYNKNSYGNIQHRTGPEARPYLDVCTVGLLAPNCDSSSRFPIVLVSAPGLETPAGQNCLAI
jgi:hypothetical protein